MGAVDTLIVWENLDITRYVLKNHSTDGMLLIIYWEYFLSSDFDDHHDLLDIVWDYEMFRVPGMLNLIFISLYQQLLVVCGKYDSSQMMLFKQGYFQNIRLQILSTKMFSLVDGKKETGTINQKYKTQVKRNHHRVEPF